MFTFKTKKRVAAEKGLRALQNAEVFIDAVELLDPLTGRVLEDEKAYVAYDLFMYGVFDAICQVNEVSKEMLLPLKKEFIMRHRKLCMRAELIFCVANSQDVSQQAFLAILDGGRTYLEWIKGNKWVPMTVVTRLEKYVVDPAFPAGSGEVLLRLFDTNSSSPGEVVSDGGATSTN